MRILSIFIVMTLALTAWAQAPNFDYAYILTDANQFAADGNVYVAPEFGDWDNDGDDDMMIGVFYNGNIQYYENSGGPGNTPEFETFSLVMADGSPIQVTYG